MSFEALKHPPLHTFHFLNQCLPSSGSPSRFLSAFTMCFGAVDRDAAALEARRTCSVATPARRDHGDAPQVTPGVEMLSHTANSTCVSCLSRSDDSRRVAASRGLPALVVLGTTLIVVLKLANLNARVRMRKA